MYFVPLCTTDLNTLQGEILRVATYDDKLYTNDIKEI